MFEKSSLFLRCFFLIQGLLFPSGKSLGDKAPLLQEKKRPFLKEEVSYELPRVVVPVFRKGRAIGYFELVAVVEAASPQGKEEVQKASPRLQNLYFSFLHEKFSPLWDRQRDIDKSNLEKHLHRLSGQVFKADTIKMISIKTFLFHKLHAYSNEDKPFSLPSVAPLKNVEP